MDVTVCRAWASSHRFNTPLELLGERGEVSLSEREYQFWEDENRTLENIKFLLSRSAFTTDSTIVLGAPIYDTAVPLFRLLKRRHRLIFHTSWPYWDGSWPQTPARFQGIRTQWERFIRGLDAVTVTQASTDALDSLGANTYRIPHPVDTETYRPTAADNVSSGETVLFVGRLVEEKGVERLLSLARGWDRPETTFVFVGRGPLEDIVQREARRENIEYRGYIHDNERLATEYANASVLALPSVPTEHWTELFGISIIEAFACGTPVVATDCVGPSEIVDDGETGYLVSRDSVAELEDAILRLLTDEDKQTRFGTNARTIAEQRYDLNVVATKWLEMLRDTSTGAAQ